MSLGGPHNIFHGQQGSFPGVKRPERDVYRSSPCSSQVKNAWIYIQGVPGECARLRENVPYVKVQRCSPKHLYPKLNRYGDNGERKVWSSCGSTYCTCFGRCYPYTAHVRTSVTQPSQAHSAFIINRCHSYSEF